MLTALIAISGASTAAALGRAAMRAESHDRVAGIRSRSSRLPGRVHATLERRLEAANLALDPETAVVSWAAVTAAGALLGASLSLALALLAVGFASVAPIVALAAARTRVERQMAAALPDLLETVASHLRSGDTVVAAIRDAAASSSPLAGDLRRIGTRLDLGADLPGALDAWVRERDLPGGRAVAGALATSAALGGPASGALEALAASLRDRLSVLAEARAQSTQARWSAGVVGLSPLGYLALTAATDSGSLTVLVTTGIGRVCLVGGLILLAAGGFVMWSMLQERW